jgi:hypothetical protein
MRSENDEIVCPAEWWYGRLLLMFLLGVLCSMSTCTANAELVPQGATNRASGEDVWVIQSISPQRLYVGEQGIQIIKVCRRAKVTEAKVERLVLKEFRSKHLAVDREYEEIKEEDSYAVTEMRYSLFPRMAGAFTIPPIKVRCELAVRSQGNGYLFGPPKQERMEVASQPVSLQALPLPAVEKNKDFSGLVGTYTLKGSLNPRKVRLGEAVTLSIILKGKGNIDHSAHLAVPELSNCKVYADAPRLVLETDSDGLGGTRTYRWGVIASECGSYTVPTISLTFFDPHLQRYRTVFTGPMSFEVLPLYGSVPSGSGKNSPLRVSGDIVAAAKTASRDYHLPWAAIFSLPAGLALVLLWRMTMKKRKAAVCPGSNDEGGLKHLRETVLGFSVTDPLGVDDCVRLKEAWKEYLETKLGTGVKNCTSQEIRGVLIAKGVHDDLADGTFNIYEILDRVCFSGKKENLPAGYVLRTMEQLAINLDTCLQAEVRARKGIRKDERDIDT